MNNKQIVNNNIESLNFKVLGDKNPKYPTPGMYILNHSIIGYELARLSKSGGTGEFIIISGLSLREMKIFLQGIMFGLEI